MKTKNEEILRIEAYNRLVKTVIKTKTNPNFIVELMKQKLRMDCNKENCQYILRQYASLQDMNKITKEINLVSGRDIRGIFSFSGRSTRFDYLKISLASNILMLTWVKIYPRLISENYFVVSVFILISIGVIWLMLAAIIRRLHDIGWSGYLSIIGFLPVLGIIFGSMLLFLDSQPGTNNYGISKKYPSGE